MKSNAFIMSQAIQFSVSVLHILESFLTTLGLQYALKLPTCGASDSGTEQVKRQNRELALEEGEDSSGWPKSFSLRHITVPASCLGVPGGHHTRSQKCHTDKQTHIHTHIQ